MCIRDSLLLLLIRLLVVVGRSRRRCCARLLRLEPRRGPLERTDARADAAAHASALVPQSAVTRHAPEHGVYGGQLRAQGVEFLDRLRRADARGPPAAPPWGA
eukprot:3693895-Alexandrium_andersonii.AAC.1